MFGQVEPQGFSGGGADLQGIETRFRTYMVLFTVHNTDLIQAGTTVVIGLGI